MLLMLAILLLGIGLLCAAYLLFRGWRLRNQIYKYDVSRDQQYDFSNSSAYKSVARLERGKLDLPPIDRAGTSVLLELRISARAMGYWLQPAIQIETTRGKWHQPVERGGSGLRYVDLT